MSLVTSGREHMVQVIRAARREPELLGTAQISLAKRPAVPDTYTAMDNYMYIYNMIYIDIANMASQVLTAIMVIRLGILLLFQCVV